MDQQTNDLIKNEIENNEVCLFVHLFVDPYYSFVFIASACNSLPIFPFNEL